MLGKTITSKVTSPSTITRFEQGAVLLKISTSTIESSKNETRILNHAKTPIINHNNTKRTYFTNANNVKKDDPYATLGLQWGATTTEIKNAFREKARRLHPDVNTADSAERALEKFRAIQKAYSTLMDVKGAPHRDDLLEEWSFSVWRNSDIIAQDRTDVAGVAHKRPIKPADTVKPGSRWGVASLGHPDGGGNKPRRGEYLGDGSSASQGPRTSTVGTGQNKWVKKKEFKPWNPKNVKVMSLSKTKK